MEMCAAILIYTPHNALDTTANLYGGSGGTQRDATGRVYTPTDGSLHQSMPSEKARPIDNSAAISGLPRCDVALALQPLGSSREVLANESAEAASTPWDHMLGVG